MELQQRGFGPAEESERARTCCVPRPGETFTIALPMRISPLTSRAGSEQFVTRAPTPGRHT